ncbi:MAG: VapA/VapB family virulence-associated protein [Myxococcaceae bacterium]|nr:VapA/VapB family virulence-associated protein [Myxococcaceae bacterium]
MKVFEGAPSPSAESLRERARQMLAAGPAALAGDACGSVHGVAAADRNAGRFGGGEVKWWSAETSRCELHFELNGTTKIFYGEGVRFPGAGACSGELCTDDLFKLLTATSNCVILSAAFYVTVTFRDGYLASLGTFIGEGFGIGGGVFAGRWV